MKFQGAIFDVDGVLVDSPHSRAWRDALRELMDTEWAIIRSRSSYSPDRFTEAVYQQVIAGLPGSPAPVPHWRTSVFLTRTPGLSVTRRPSRNICDDS